MAGFAVDIGDAGAAYEQGVTAPSTTETAAAAQGLNMLGKGVFGLLDDYADATKKTAPTEASVNREAFATLSQSIQSTKGMSPLQQRTAVNSALASHFAQGGEVGEAESKMIKMTTGIDVNYLNANPQQDAINSTIEELQKNPAYLYQAEAGLRATGQPFTQEDVYTNAMAAVQKNEAAALYLVNSKNIAESEFLQTFVPHANSMLGDVRSLAFSALKIETEGGNVRPERLVQLKAELTKVKAILAKPAQVSAEAYQGIQAQVDTLEGLMTTIMSYDEDVLTQEKADILEPITKALMDQARQIGETDPVLASVLLSGDTQFLSTYAAQKYPEVMKTLNNMKVEDTVYTDLPSFTPDGTEIAADGDETIVETVLHNDEEIEKATDRTNTARKDAVFFATTEKLRLSTVEGMNDPAHRENFLNGIGQATVNIATSGMPFDQRTLDEVVHDNVLNKLKAVEKLDPEAAKLARNRLQDALKAQYNIVSTTASGSLKSSFFNVTALGKIEYDLDARTLEGETRIGKEANSMVRTLANKYYKGDVTALVVNENRSARNRQMSTQERAALEATGFKLRNVYMDYSKVQEIARKLSYYPKQLKRLGVNTDAIEAIAIKPVGLSPLVGNNADNPMQIVWSDDTDTDEKLFATLEDGQYFTGPDGNVYVKGEQLNGQ
jgi:hypothetical protein